ncbi:hypothetical protein GWI33_017867 [Rhynchophorus ferrugineus]|uniref:Uncharacterized protein n=1 Tax=Rhynchophorus ferrugineus TaxID=354439 RepID=A0A834HXI9_RHYFE|nr:hypothetical protein GWI33_017867 [Rhynchophorus ferrugineus]
MTRRLDLIPRRRRLWNPRPLFFFRDPNGFPLASGSTGHGPTPTRRPAIGRRDVTPGPSRKTKESPPDRGRGLIGGPLSGCMSGARIAAVPRPYVAVRRAWQRDGH